MTAPEFDQSLRALVTANPYRVFTVELKNGHRFDVDRPNAIAFRDGVAVYLARGGIPVFFNHRELRAIIIP
jgi:hypothetical protein